jgi:acyl-CoA thioesterase
MKLHLKNYAHPDKYGKLMGYRYERLNKKKREAFLSLKLADKHLSTAGRVHGGVVSGFFDTALGAAVFTTLNEGDFTSTVELKVNYFKPLEKGDHLRCHARVVFCGRRLRSVHALLYRNRVKEPVAMASGTFYVVSGKST